MENIIQAIRSYPDKAAAYAEKILSLILQTAQEEKKTFTETGLKWGEPSFKTPKGSPFRIDWKEITPEKFYIFFNCKTTLVERFKSIYGENLTYQKNRAIILDMNKPIPEEILKQCFSTAMNYHGEKGLK